MNSGRRALPEIGSYVLLSFKQSDISTPQILRYLSVDEYNAILNSGQLDNAEASASTQSDSSKAKPGQIPYRILRPGEIEDFSSGGARVWLSSRGRWEANGGNNAMWLDRDDMEAGVASPEFRIEGMNIDSLRMRDVLRFGVISRNTGGSNRYKKYAEHEGQFAREFYYNLRWMGTPNDLVTHQEGICFDDAGALVMEEVTGHILRARKIYGTKSGNKTSTFVDENGNIRTIIASDADRGYFLDMRGATSTMTVDVGQHVKRTVGQNETDNIGLNRERTIGVNDTLSVNGNQTKTVGGNISSSAGGTASYSAATIFLN